MANWPWADAESPGPPVLINCANLISSHQSLWKVLLRGPREQPLLSKERPPSALSPTRPGAVVSLPLLRGAAAVKNIKAVFPGDGKEQGVWRPAWPSVRCGPRGAGAGPDPGVCPGSTAVAQAPTEPLGELESWGPLGRLGTLTVTLLRAALTFTICSLPHTCWIRRPRAGPSVGAEGSCPPSRPSAPPVTTLPSASLRPADCPSLQPQGGEGFCRHPRGPPARVLGTALTRPLCGSRLHPFRKGPECSDRAPLETGGDPRQGCRAGPQLPLGPQDPADPGAGQER